MELSEILQPSLDTPLFNQLLPFLYFGLGALVAFILRGLLILMRKKRYQNLTALLQSLVDSVEIENRLRKEKIDLLDNGSPNKKLEFNNFAYGMFDEKTHILTRQNSEKSDYCLLYNLGGHPAYDRLFLAA